MRRFAVVTLGVLGAWVASGPATGLTLDTQDRQVHARAQFTPFFQPPNPVDEHSQSATDFGPFLASVGANVTNVSVGSADSSASQDSSIEQPRPAWLDTRMTGGANAFASNRNVPIDMASWSDSTYLLTFTLAEELDYVLRAVIGVSESSMEFASGGGQVRVELFRDGSEVIEQLLLDTVVGQGSIQDTLDASGSLAPGSYSLRVTASASAYAVRYFGVPIETFSSGSASYDVGLQLVPEPATALLLAGGLLALARRWRAPGRG